MGVRTWARRGAAAALAAVSIGALSGTPAWADHIGDVNCSAFTYQEDAQDHLNRHPGDPDNLDGNPENGIACESLPHRPSTPAPPPPPPGEQCVRGAIEARWFFLGGARGPLGPSVTCELITPNGAAHYTHFTNGSIYWSQSTGAQDVRGAIKGRWADMGWETSWLRLPTTGENALRGGAFNHFQGGSVYWSPATGAHAVRGLIFDEWGATGWENGVLGYPTTSETPIRGGAFNHFQGGSIYWSPTTGAHVVRGAIREAWAAQGWETGRLGYPTSDEYDVPGGRRSDFAGGSITWTPAGGAVVSYAGT
ncbi:LGFP repeat-containing protein [Kineococcus auxinigenes]|uniref:LGFP repeat-containing protein n=1 Tax=unclassified Kineococcus TaxID=2621656 RepID=UPI003D7E33A9